MFQEFGLFHVYQCLSSYFDLEKYEVRMTVRIKFTVLRDVTQCSLVGR
jgi:hypothetical protein